MNVLSPTKQAQMYRNGSGPVRLWSRTLVVLLLLASGARAQEPGTSQAARGVVARASAPAASFAARQPGSDGFKVLPENADLYSGDLLVALPGASLQGKNGAVSVKSLADYDGKSPLPALETAFTLNEPKDVDLDVALDRGRVDLTNTKADGAAVVQVRFWDQVWKVTLDSPGTRVALELYGRWPAGSRFKPVRPDDTDATKAAPVASLVLLVLKGSAAVNVGGVTMGMKAPPGPALLEWDSLGIAPPTLQKQEKLPPWAEPNAELSADGKKAAEAVEKFRKARAENPQAAITSFLNSGDPAEQRVALVTLGALDDIGRLGQQIGNAKTQEEWDFGVTILRHWLGRSQGHDQKLYAALTSPTQGYTPAHARIIMQLLFGFSPDDLRQPETYEVLIDYLTHDKAAIRNLAAWHLVRLVPQGKSIAYNPNATKEECQKTHREWKKLVPSGQIPSSPSKKQ